MLRFAGLTFRTFTWSLALLWVLSAGAFAQEKTPITLWIAELPANVVEWAETEFEPRVNALNPDIDFDFQLVPFDDLREKIVVSALSGAGPDIGYFPTNLLPSWIHQGFSRPIEEYFERMPGKDAFVPAILDAVRDTQGRLHGLPFAMWFIPDLYNLDVFANNGVALPETWDEMIVSARRNTSLRSDGTLDTSGYAIQMNRYTIYFLHTFMELLQPGGGILYLGDERARLNNEIGQRAMDYLYELVNTGMPTYIPFDLNRLVGGKLAIRANALFYSYAIRPDIMDAMHIVGRSVVGPTADVKGMPWNAGNLFMVSTTPNPDKAWRVMEAWVDPENLIQFHRLQKSWLPVRGDLFDVIEEVYPNRAEEIVAMFGEPLVTYGPMHGYWNALAGTAGNMITAALRNEVPPSQALIQVEEYINSYLASQASN